MNSKHGKFSVPQAIPLQNLDTAIGTMDISFNMMHNLMLTFAKQPIIKSYFTNNIVEVSYMSFRQMVLTTR